MKSSLAILIALLISITSVNLAYASSNEAALTWLQLIDDKQYDASWNNAAPFFQSQLNTSKWQATLTHIRGSLGKVLNRKEVASKSMQSLPGMPKGDYLVIQYLTQFKNKANAVETITLSKVDNKWLAVGYFIK